MHEFAKRCTTGDSDVEQYNLQRLFQLDDMEHYSQRVWDDFQLGLYDVAEPHQCHKHFMSLGDVNVFQPCEQFQKRCNDLQTHLSVRAVSSCNHVDI